MEYGISEKESVCKKRARIIERTSKNSFAPEQCNSTHNNLCIVGTRHVFGCLCTGWFLGNVAIFRSNFIHSKQEFPSKNSRYVFPRSAFDLMKKKIIGMEKTNWKRFRFRFRCLNNCKKIRIHKLYSSWLMTWFIRAVWARSLGWKRTIEIWPRCLSSPCLNVTCYTFEKEVIKLNGEVGLLFTNSVNDDGIKYTSSRARAIA